MKFLSKWERKLEENKKVNFYKFGGSLVQYVKNCFRLVDLNCQFLFLVSTFLKLAI